MKCNWKRKGIALLLLVTLFVANFAGEVKADGFMAVATEDESNTEVASTEAPYVPTMISFSKWLNEGTSNEIVLNQYKQEMESRFTAEKSGRLYFRMLSSKNNKENVSAELVCEEDGSTLEVISKKMTANKKIVSMPAVEEGKTYLLRVTGNNLKRKNTYYWKACVVSNETDRRLLNSYSSSNSSIAAGTDENGNRNIIYWERYVSKKGRLYIHAADVANATGSKNVYVTLLDSKKRVISARTALNDETAYYGVAGGKTYYIKVDTYAKLYGIKGGMDTSYSNVVGASKSKATTLTKNKYKYTTLPASTSTASQWYKFKNSKKRDLKIYFQGYLSPGYSVTVSLINKNGKVLEKKSTIGIKNQKHTISIKGDLVPAGTYYVKVSKNSTKSSAAYKIRYTY